MIITKPKTAFQMIVGALLLTFVAIGCNDSSETKKEATEDTTVTVTPDTMKMDTATTRPPVKNPD